MCKVLVLLLALTASIISVGYANEPEPIVLTSYKQALDTMRKHNAPGIFVFSATWCEPCHRMKRETWEPLMDEIKSKYILYFIDIDAEPKVYAAYYQQGRVRHVPAYCITNKGASCTIAYAEGYKDKVTFVKWANAEIARWKNRQTSPEKKDTAPTALVLK